MRIGDLVMMCLDLFLSTVIRIHRDYLGVHTYISARLRRASGIMAQFLQVSRFPT